MFHFEMYEHTSLYGQFYRFPKRGDGIPMHDHVEEQKHNIMVMRGSVLVYGPDKAWVHTVSAGEIMNLGCDQHPHEIAALEDDTVIIGMFIHGKPEGECLPERCKRGIIDRPLTIPLD